jgi:hypothetical protein
MFNLLHARLGETPFTYGCLGGFLNKAVQHHDSLTDLCAEKDTRDTFGAFQTQLKQAITKCLGVRLSQIRPKTNIRRVRTTYRAASVSGKEAIAAWTASL